jgi:hypothetical protein
MFLRIIIKSSLSLNINMKCGVFILYFLFKLTETNYAMLLITQKTTITQRFWSFFFDFSKEFTQHFYQRKLQKFWINLWNRILFWINISNKIFKWYICKILRFFDDRWLNKRQLNIQHWNKLISLRKHFSLFSEQTNSSISFNSSFDTI